MPKRILIDADGCPVVNISARLAKKYNVKCIILCDTSHEIQREGTETIVVEKGADSVDFKLANMIEKDDIAVTQDYGLAAMCLSRSAKALNQNGLLYTDDNIDSLLFSRYIGKKVRKAGGHLKGPKKRTVKQNEDFEKSLENLLK